MALKKKPKQISYLSNISAVENFENNEGGLFDREYL